MANKKIDDEHMETTLIFSKTDLLKEKVGYQAELVRHEKIVENMKENIAKVNEKLEVFN